MLIEAIAKKIISPQQPDNLLRRVSLSCRGENTSAQQPVVLCLLKTYMRSILAQ